MRRYPRFIVLSALLVMVLCTSSPALAQSFSSLSFEEMPSLSGKISARCEPLADLFLQLMTRPGVTDDSDIRALHSAAQGAALSFRQSAFHGPGGIVKWARFTKNVGVLVHNYQKEYALALDGIAGAEARGAALDRLLDGLLRASVRSGISLEEFDVALLRGAATVEAMISERPLSNELSLADRELVMFLLRSIVHQDRRRILLDATRAALQHLHAAEEITTPYVSQIYTVLRPVLTREFVGLENTLADPLVVSDPERILVAEYNTEAVSDLFAMKYGLELFSLSLRLRDWLFSSLAELMPGMTPEILEEQLGQISITTLAAYLSAAPHPRLAYVPVSGLADRLAVLGVTPPSLPDFSLFPDSFRSLIRMQYDIRLCDLITATEWSLANNAVQGLNRLPSLGEQLVLKEAAMKRLSRVRAHIRGVSEKDAEALQILLESGLMMRI